MNSNTTSWEAAFYLTASRHQQEVPQAHGALTTSPNTEASAPSLTYSCFHVSNDFSALHLKHFLNCKNVKISMGSISEICMETAVVVAEKLTSRRKKKTKHTLSSLLEISCQGSRMNSTAFRCNYETKCWGFHRTSTKIGSTARSESGSPENPRHTDWAAQHNKPSSFPKQTVWPSQQCFQITHSQTNRRQHKTAMKEGANSVPAVTIYFMLFSNIETVRKCVVQVPVCPKKQNPITVSTSARSIPNCHCLKLQLHS